MRDRMKIAGVAPTRSYRKKRPAHAELRQLIQHSEISSVDMIRQDRDKR